MSHLNNIGVSMLEKLCIYLVNLKVTRSKICYALKKLKVCKIKHVLVGNLQTLFFEKNCFTCFDKI